MHMTHIPLSKNIHRSKGFTLIEVMIAMTIFTVLVTIGIGAVLDTIQQHYTTQNTRTVMDSLNFVMEDMARNIRLGTNMSCGTDTPPPTSGPITPHSCPLTTIATANNTLTFNDLNGNVVTYTISPPIGSTPSQILKQEGSGSAEVITPPEVSMNFAASGFTVRGAETSAAGGDFSQPTVIIRLSGTIKYKNTNSNFAIETAVTLRALDS